MQKTVTKLIKTEHGLDVKLCQMPTRSSAAVFTVLAGYGKEKFSEYGISHLIEHMSFKGSKTMDSDRMTRALALCGAEWNASTSPHFVNYYLHCPSINMPRALSILSGVFFSPEMSDKDLASEKKVVESEASDHWDDPSSCFQDKAIEYHLDPAVGHSCFGKKSVVRKLEVSDLINFRKSHYRAPNSVLSVCGGFDLGEVEKTIKEFSVSPFFSSGKKEYVECGIWRPSAKTERIIYKDGITQANLIALFPAPSAISAKGAAYKIMLSVLGGGTFSILHRRMREELAMCYGVSSDEEVFLRNNDFSMGSIEMSCHGSKMNKAIDELKICMSKLSSGDFDTELVECAKQSKIGFLCDTADTPLGTAFVHSTRSIFGDNESDLGSIASAYLAVTKEDVIKSAKEFLIQDEIRWTILAPTKK